ncbi:MAG: hypothetical protein DRI57_08850, partial [Deltaproteobacteria bacterium]
TLKCEHSTIANNTAANGLGGGIENYDGLTVEIRNSILAGNTAGNSGPDIYGSFTSHDYNLIGNNLFRIPNIDFTPQPHDKFGTNDAPLNPLLGALADNGGLTQTQALQPGSPAINAGTCKDIGGNYITDDQRGFARPQPDGSKCDIGAYEAPGIFGNIEVNTNLSMAEYTLVGPTTYTGSGIEWSKDDAVAGSYTITYRNLSCWETPPSETKILGDGEITFTGEYTDETDPENLELKETNPLSGEWSNDNTITVSWRAGSDCGSGVAGYSYVWDSNPTTAPDNEVETTGTEITSPELLDGTGHYFHVCTVDNAGNQSTTLHIGPFYIDTVKPTASADPKSGLHNADMTVELSCSDSGGSDCDQIYYSTSGSPPTVSALFLYDDGEKISIPITDERRTVELKFFAVDKAGNKGDMVTEEYDMDPTLPVTTANIEGGYYNSRQLITLECTSGTGSVCAGTYYTLDGNKPDVSPGNLYDPSTNPIFITAEGLTVLRFFSVNEAGSKEHPEKEQRYTLDSCSPGVSAEPPYKDDDEPFEVELKCEDCGGEENQGTGCTIYYSTDETDPLPDDQHLYSVPVVISQWEHKTNLKYFATDKAGNISGQVMTAYYGLYDETPPKTSAYPPGGPSDSNLTITLTCDDGTGSGCEKIYYTLDGSDPKTEGNSARKEYASPIKIAEQELMECVTLRFFGRDNSGNAESQANEEKYCYEDEKIPPVTSAVPGGGNYRETPVEVKLECKDEGGAGCDKTRYTTGGTEPDDTSPVYASPFSISESTWIKFFSVDKVGNAEAPQTVHYVIDKKSPTIEITSPQGSTQADTLTQVRGTAQDANGVENAELQISNGTWFLATESEQQYITKIEKWLPVTVQNGEWSFDVEENLPWGCYTITARAWDKAGNMAENSVKDVCIAPCERDSTITLNPLSKDAVAVGERLQVSGKITPEPTESASGVNIEISNGADTVNLPVFANSNGNFYYDLRCGDIPGQGEWTIKASWAGYQMLCGAESKENPTLSVSKARTRVALDAASHVLRLGDSLSFRGRFKTEPDCGEIPEGIEIILEIKGPGRESYETVLYPDALGFFALDETDAYEGFGSLGEWTVQAVFEGNGAYEKSETGLITRKVLETAGYAIIVQGKVNSDEGLDSHNRTTNFVYETLKGRGLQDDDIQYFNYDTEQPFVDDSPLKGEIGKAVTEWAQERMNENAANLYIVMVDHGLRNEFFIDPGTISPEDLDGWLDTLQGGLEGDAENQEILVVLGFCYSGSFIEKVTGENRVIITSAAADEVSYKGPDDGEIVRDGEYFVTRFFSNIALEKSVSRSFREAVAATESFTASASKQAVAPPYFDRALQHPLLEDDGDGTGTNNLGDIEGDGDFGDDLFVGVMNNIGVNSLQVSSTSSKIEFLDAGQDTLDELGAVVYNIFDDTKSAWCEVKPLNFTPVNTGGSGQGVVDTGRQPGDKKGEGLNGGDRFEWRNIGGFSEPGTYQVFIFAEDVYGNVSPSEEVWVYKAKSGNNPPDSFIIESPKDGNTVSTRAILDWQDTTDPDGDSLSYMVVFSKQDFDSWTYNAGQSIYKRVGECSICLASSEDGLKDQTDYYWRVWAIDEYGAVTKSNTEKFHTDNFDNPVPAWIGGHVYNSILNNPVSNAIMNVLGRTENTLSSFTTDAAGCYVAEISRDDAYAISVGEYKSSPPIINWTVPWRRSSRSNDYRKEEVMIKNFDLSGVAEPQFSPFPGVVSKEQEIRLSCPTTGAKIYYTIGESEPDENSTPYSEPIVLDEPMTIKAVAYMDGLETSEVVTGEYCLFNKTGDLNADCEIDLADAIAGLQFFAGYDVSVAKEAALDGEKVGLVDVVSILQKVAEMR